jgi:penicillin-insensitive murein DD-endopeptidase
MRPLATEGVAHGSIARRAPPLGPAAIHFGRSIGSPTEGRLVGGAHLDETPYLRILPAYVGGDVRWGLEPLVTMIDRAARSVHREFPGAILLVGQLSRAGGGDIDRHRSHESGRDADIAFFLRGAADKQLMPAHFVRVGTDGASSAWPGAYFDDAKNWALVAALVSDPEAHVSHLFVAAPLRARLLAYAEKMGAPASVRLRAAEAMQQPRGALPHDDHFHVRIACPAHMPGCVENPTVPALRSAGSSGGAQTSPPASRRRGGPAIPASTP